MITVADLELIAAATSEPVPMAAYRMVDPKPWGLGYAVWKESRWQEVRADMGIDEATFRIVEVRTPLVSFFHEACARAVRRALGVVE